LNPYEKVLFRQNEQAPIKDKIDYVNPVFSEEITDEEMEVDIEIISNCHHK